MTFCKKLSSLKVVSIISASLVSSFICLGIDGSDVSAASLTLTIPDSPVALNLTPSSSGTFTKSTGSNVSVKSDAYFGYTLTIKGKSSDNSLVSSSGSKIASIASSITEDDFKTNTSYNNKWGYIPSKLYSTSTNTSTANTNYIAGPTTTATNTIDKTTSANATSANHYTLTIAAKVDSTLPHGKYSNSFTFSAIANSVNYSIHYNLNSGSGGPSTNPQTGNTTEANVKLDSTPPTREGYTFEGWCDQETSDEACGGGGTTYEAGANYPLINDVNNIELYAIWKVAGPIDLGDLGSMQDFTCSKITTTESWGTVTDSRDNNTYKVSRLKDGKCWMVENLRIAGKTLTPADSDVASNFVIPDSSTSGFNYDVAGVYIDSTYGGYYTWYAATAGEGKESVSSGSVSHSICPKSWRLPTGGSGGEFQALSTVYGGTDSTAATAIMAKDPGPGFTLAGHYSGSIDNSQGSYGDYWSVNAYSPNFAYLLYFNSSNVNPTGYGSKFGGFSVRCISRR